MSTPAAGSPSERDPEQDRAAWEQLVRQLQEQDPAPGDPFERPDPELREPPVAVPTRGPRDFELAEEAEEDWQPQDPGDVMAGLRPTTLLAWVLLIGVGVGLVVLGILLDGLPWWLWLPGLAIVLGAVTSLLQSLPERHRDDDDGARV